MSTKTKTAISNRTIDGIVRAPRTGVPTTRPKKAAQAVHRGVQRSHTLMRTAVSKPKAIATHKAYRPKLNKSTGQVLDIARISRAKATATHGKVRRFGSNESTKAKVKALTNTKNIGQSDQSTRVMQNRVKPMPSMITSVSHHQLERLLDHALFRADAHKKANHANNGIGRKLGLTGRKSKLMTASVTMVLVVAIAGFFAWHNVPQVAVEVASVRSSVEATVPEYSPSGFSFQGPIAVAGNSVSMKFKSNADPARTYTINQQSSDWDSQSLLANYVETKGIDYQTTQVKGSTVYIWNDNKEATWVNNGVWYTVSDQAGLSSDQLYKLIESL